MIRRVVPVLFLFLLANCTYLPKGNYFTKGVAQYTGDGVIRDKSQRSLFFGSRGYVVDFGIFDLGSTFRAHFRLSNLPIIKGSSVVIYNDLVDGSQPEISITNETFVARLDVTLNRTSGIPVTGYSSAVRAARYPRLHQDPEYFLYCARPSPTSAMCFKLEAGETYLLDVTYFPDANLKGKQMKLYLSCFCGGS